MEHQYSNSEEHTKLRNYHPLLSLMRFQQHSFETRQRLLGGPYTSGVIRLVLLGWMERRPYDLSAMASALALTRQIIMRKVGELELAGYVDTERVRNRVLVHPTPKLLDHILTICPRFIYSHIELLEKVVEEINDRGIPWSPCSDPPKPLELGTTAEFVAA